MKSTLFIIDAYNLIYRMFYAIPEMHTRDGRQVNAIFGVAKFLKWLAEENPDAELVVANDVGKSFRADMFAEYKAQRDRMPDNLRSQIDGVFALFDAAGIQVLSEEWYEADDIIGSLAATCHTDARQIVIISSDKDLCQFVQDGCVHIYDAMKRKFMKRADVVEKFGVPPEQVRDYLAIVGDSSDNIPGISGFGPKKAVDLLTKYGTLEWVYEHLHDLTPKMQEVLIAQKENAFLSKDLATIVTDLNVDVTGSENFVKGVTNPEYIGLIREYEFKSLLPKEEATSQSKVDIQITEIATLKKLDSLISMIQSGKNPTTVSLDIYGKLILGLSEEVYAIDTKKVDVQELVSLLLSGTVELVGYDLKADLKRLYRIQKPAEVAGSEGQGKLF